eukprot:1194751-Prorocentrum_minimum.AAC.4
MSHQSEPFGRMQPGRNDSSPSPARKFGIACEHIYAQALRRCCSNVVAVNRFACHRIACDDSRSLRTNRRTGDGIYPAREPIAGGETVYTQRENLSQEGRQYIPSVRTNHRRGDGIYPV